MKCDRTMISNVALRVGVDSPDLEAYSHILLILSLTCQSSGFDGFATIRYHSEINYSLVNSPTYRELVCRGLGSGLRARQAMSFFSWPRRGP